MLLDTMLNVTAHNSCTRYYMNCLFPSSSPFTLLGGKEFLKRQTILDFNGVCLSSYFNCLGTKTESFSTIVTKAASNTTSYLALNASSISSKIFSNQSVVTTKIIPSRLSTHSDGLIDIWLVIACIIGYLALYITFVWTVRLVHYFRRKRNAS